MKDFLAQLDMLAQGDADQWIDLLVVVVLGVFYAVAAMIRTARKKSQEAQRDRSANLRPGPPESWQQRLARKAQEIQRAVAAKSKEAAERMQRLEQQARMRDSMAESQSARGHASQTPRPQTGKVVARTGRGGEPVLVYERSEAGGDAARKRHSMHERRAEEAISAAGREAAMQPTYASLPRQPADVPLGPVAPGEGPLMTPAEPLGYDPASIIDYSDPDALQKAVLHYEILGKPVGLRNPFEHGAAL